MRKSVLILLTALIAMPLSAESYSYDDLYLSMRENSTELRSAEEALVQSRLDVKDAEANYHPNISVMGFASYMTDPLIGPITVNSNDLLSQIGLPTTSHGQDVTIYDGMDETYYGAAITIQQPLITWGKITNSVRLYKELEGVKEIQKTDTEKQLAAELKARLAALYYIDLIIGELEKTEKASSELIALMRSSGDEGMVLQEEVLSAEVKAKETEVARAELAAQRAQLLQSLRSLTGISTLELSEIDYAPSEEEYDAILSYPLEALMELASSDSSRALQMLAKADKALEYSQKIADASMYGVPDFSLNLSLYFAGPRFPGEPGWSSEDHWGISGSIFFSTTLWDGGKKLNDRDRAASRRRDNQITAEETRNTLREAVTECYTSAELARTRISYLEKVAQSNALKSANAQKRYDSGFGSRADILQCSIEEYSGQIEILREKITLSQNAYTLYYLASIDPDRPYLVSDGMRNDTATAE